MAAPIAHIFLALQILSGPLKGLFNEKEFILGTSFPDIRYLNIIGRNNTHFDDVTFEQLKQERDSFKAGMLFHSFVDEQREQYVVEHNLYDLIPHFKFMTQSLKFAEDILLCPLIDTSKFISYFDERVPQESTFNVSDENVQRWHLFLKDYCNQKFSSHDLIMKYFDLHKPDAWRITRWYFSWYYASTGDRAITTVVNNEQAKSAILNFYLNFSKNNCQTT